MKIKLIRTKLTRFSFIAIIIIIIAVVAFIVSALTWDKAKGFNYLGLAFIIIFILTFFIQLFHSFVNKDFDIIGEMLLDSDNIQVNLKDNSSSTIEIAQIKAIDFLYYGYDGESFPYESSASISNFVPKQGNNNMLSLTMNNNSKIKYEFFLETRKQSLSLIESIRHFENKGISINIKSEFKDSIFGDNIFKK